VVTNDVLDVHVDDGDDVVNRRRIWTCWKRTSYTPVTLPSCTKLSMDWTGNDPP
jgi:hypothetical protein